MNILYCSFDALNCVAITVRWFTLSESNSAAEGRTFFIFRNIHKANSTYTL